MPLLLSDLVKKTVISTGQQTIPISTFGYDIETLTDVLELSIGEYEKYRPYRKRVVLPLSPEGFYMPDVIRIQNVRINNASVVEFTQPLNFRLWEFSDDKKLTTTYTGVFYVEYLAKYTFNYLDFIGIGILPITPFDDTISFTNKGSFKKGTLNISITDIVSNTTYTLSDDLGSYIALESNFTVDEINNVITITENVGKKLKTGSVVRFSSDDTLPTELNNTNDFYLIKESDVTFKVATSYSNAFNNTSVTLDSGTGTHTLTTKVTSPIINLVGSLGSGTYNLETNKINIDLGVSIEGSLNVSYKTQEKGIQELDTDEALFMKLFKANFMISLGLNKSILKMDGLPWDFSIDDLVSKGEKMKESLEDKEMPDKGKWYYFR